MRKFIMETLVMPMNYVELQEDEMMYLDGGLYISQGTAQGVLGALMMNPATIISGVIAYSAGVKIINYFSNFGGLYGWIAKAILTFAAGQVIKFVTGLAYTALEGGREFSWSWHPLNFGVQW